MQIDDIFRIGLKHIKSGFPCEDYSTSGYLDNLEHCYAVLSDGCSGSNGMTDIGARLWCLSYVDTLKKSKNNELFLDEDFILRMFNYFNEHSFLPTRYDETASLVMLLANKNKAQICLFGDGGYCLEKNDGTIVLVECSWRKNRPYYPIFKLEEELRGNDKGLGAFQLNNKPVMKKQIKIFVPTTFGITKSYKLIEEKKEGYLFEDVEFGSLNLFDRVKDEIKSISIFSDGLWTIQNNSLNGVINDIMSFNSEKAENNYGFLKRKISPLFESWNNTNSYPLDDFSMGTLIW